MIPQLNSVFVERMHYDVAARAGYVSVILNVQDSAPADIHVSSLTISFSYSIIPFVSPFDLSLSQYNEPSPLYTLSCGG